MKCNKRTFHSEHQASNALSNAWQSMRTCKMPVRYYKCNLCTGWHLTSKPLMSVAELRQSHRLRKV